MSEQNARLDQSGYKAKHNQFLMSQVQNVMPGNAFHRHGHENRRLSPSRHRLPGRAGPAPRHPRVCLQAQPPDRGARRGHRLCHDVAHSALFAEVERDLISEHTREGLAKARASGKKLGRSRGSLGVSRLDGKEDETPHFLRLGVSKNAMFKITVSRPTLYHFIDSKGLRLDP